MRKVVAAAHVHSTWSYDGIWSLPEIAVAFRVFGFDAVLMAEHDRGFTPTRWDSYVAACAESSRGILLLPGLEYGDPSDVVHVTVWGSVPFLGAGRPTNELLADAQREHAVAVLAHPARRDAWKVVDDAWFGQLDGVELWNRRYDGASPSAIAPDLLRKCNGGMGFFAADFHNVRGLTPLAMTVEVEGAVSTDSVVEALQRRRAFGVSRSLSAEGLRRFVLGCAHKAHVLEPLAKRAGVRPA